MADMSKETLTVRLDAGLRDTLDSIAESLERDRTYVVNQALQAYVDVHAWHVSHIQQGLQEANAGKFSSPAEVKRVTSRLRSK